MKNDSRENVSSNNIWAIFHVFVIQFRSFSFHRLTSVTNYTLRVCWWILKKVVEYLWFCKILFSIITNLMEVSKGIFLSPKLFIMNPSKKLTTKNTSSWFAEWLNFPNSSTASLIARLLSPSGSSQLSLVDKILELFSFYFTSIQGPQETRTIHSFIIQCRDKFSNDEHHSTWGRFPLRFSIIWSGIKLKCFYGLLREKVSNIWDWSF